MVTLNVTQHNSPHNQPVSANVKLERAMAAKLIENQTLLIQYTPTLDKRMFIEPSTFLAVYLACGLRTEERYTQVNHEYRLEKEGIKDANALLSTIFASVSPSSDFAKHLYDWLDGGIQRFIKASEAELTNAGCTTAELIERKQEILEKARTLGKVDDGVELPEGIEQGSEWLTNLRNATKNSSIARIGFPAIDREIIGMLPATLTTVGARPSVGKTTLALKIALNVLNTKGTVLFNSLEMSFPRVSIKMAALINKQNSMKYEQAFEAEEDDFIAVLDMLNKAKRKGISFLAKRDLWALESSIMAKPPTLVIYDYLQLTPTPHGFRGNRAEYISEVARNLQQIAVRTNVPILLLAQLNRSADGVSAGLGNLKDSSGIEEASDNVIFLEQPEADSNGMDVYRRLLTIKKARSGRAGSSIELMLNPIHGTLIEWDTVTASKAWNAMQSPNKIIQEPLL